MSYEGSRKSASPVSTRGRSGDTVGAPGKRTRTSQLPGPRVGIPIVDDGFGCDNASGDGCFLDDKQRSVLLASHMTVVSSTMDNFHAAIQNVRLDKHTSKSSTWGFWAEFVFHSVSGPILAAASNALKGVKAAVDKAKSDRTYFRAFGIDVPPSAADRLRGAIAALPETHFSASLQNVSRGVRTELKHGSNGPGGWDRFLKVIQNGLKEIHDGLVLDVPAGLNDAEFVALVLSYRDAKAHSVAAYEDILRDLITRFEQQKLDQVGNKAANGATTRLVMLTAYGHRRTAVVEDGGANLPAQDGSMVENVRPVGPDGKRKLLSLLDADLAAYAPQLGAVGETIDVTNGHPFELPDDDQLLRHVKVEFDAWIARAKANPHPNVEPISPEDQAEDAGRDVVEAIVDMPWTMLKS